MSTQKLKKSYGPGDYVPPGAMLQSARGGDAGHNGAYKGERPVDITLRATIRDGRIAYEVFGPKDLQPGTHPANLVVVK